MLFGGELLLLRALVVWQLCGAVCCCWLSFAWYCFVFVAVICCSLFVLCSCLFRLRLRVVCCCFEWLDAVRRALHVAVVRCSYVIVCCCLVCSLLLFVVRCLLSVVC